MKVGEQPPATFPLARFLGLVALLVGEALVMTLSFDTGGLDRSSGLWAKVLDLSPEVLPLVFASGAGLVLVMRGPVLETLRAHTLWIRAKRRMWPTVLLHTLGLLAFAACTAALLSRDAPSGLRAWLLLGGWATSAGLVGMTWALFLFPGALWLELLRRHPRPLGAALLLGLLGWAGGNLTASLWTKLPDLTFWSVQTLLGSVTDLEVVDREEAILALDEFAVRISSSCSGYEGIGLIWVYVGAYLWIFRDGLRFPRALWLLPVGTVLIFMANTLRISGLLLLGEHVSREVAVGGFHSTAGWIFFCVVGLMLIGVAHTSDWFRRAPDAAAAEHRAPRADPELLTALLLPLMVFLATAMLTAAFTAGAFDALYGVRVVTAGVVLWLYRAHYPTLKPEGIPWAALLGGLAVYGLWLALAPTSAQRAEAIAGHLDTLPAALALTWILLRGAGTIVIAPIVEELAFRSFLMRRLIRADFDAVALGHFAWPAFVISSAVFGLLHGAWLAGCLAGAVYALVLVRTKRIFDPVLAHALTNALLFVHAWSAGRWDLM